MNNLNKEQLGLLWSGGMLDYLLRPEQLRFKSEIERPDKQLIVANVSRRWGKSYSSVVYCMEQALRSKQKIRFAAAYQTDLVEFILPAFHQILADCPEHLKPEYIRSRSTWEFKNGSEIKLVGLDRSPNGLRGNAISIIVLDECGFVADLKYIYTSIIVPATAKQKNIKIIMISTPPQSPEHAFVEMMEKAQTQPNGYYLCLTIDDISDLDPAEKERLLNEVGGKDSAAAQREFYCKVIIDTNRAIAPSFSRAHVTTQEFEHISWRLFADSGGVQDKTSFLRVGYCHDTGKVIFRDELFFDRGTNTQQIVSKVKEVYPGLGLTMDMAGQLRVDYSSMDLPAASPMKDDFEAGLLLLNTSFHNNKVLIHEDCKMLIRTLEGGLLNKARTDYERTQALGHADAVAAAIYALRGVDRVTDLRPSKHKPGTTIWKPSMMSDQVSGHPLAQLNFGNQSDW
jgi:hypothetical protein